MYEAGFSGDPPSGNCSDKINAWIIREAQQHPHEIYTLVGDFIGEFMDYDWSFNSQRQAEVDRLRAIFAKNVLSYTQGGHLFGGAVSEPSKSLSDHLRTRNIPEIELEFNRALSSVETDPPAALTAGCAILESFCRVYLQEENLPLPSSCTAKPLWTAVSCHLGLAPSQQMDDDIKKVLSGLSSVVDGIACSRTHDGSAHGREKRDYKVQPRHARLVAHAAHTLVLFALETWAERKCLSSN